MNRTGAEMMLKSFLSTAIYKPPELDKIFFILVSVGSILFEPLVVIAVEQAQ